MNLFNRKKKIDGYEQLSRFGESEKRRRCDMKLDGKDPKHFDEVLRVVGNEEIERLKLHDCFENYKKFAQVLQAICDNPTKKPIILDVKHNDCDKSCIKILKKLLKRQRISQFFSPRCGSGDIYDLLGVIANPKLKNEMNVLDLAKNRLSKGSLRRLRRAIRLNKIKRTLDLSECSAEDGSLLILDDRKRMENAKIHNKTLHITWFSIGQVQHAENQSIFGQILGAPSGVNRTLELIPDEEVRMKIALSFYKTIGRVARMFEKKTATTTPEWHYPSSEESESDVSMSSDSEDEERFATIRPLSPNDHDTRPGQQNSTLGYRRKPDPMRLNEVDTRDVELNQRVEDRSLTGGWRDQGRSRSLFEKLDN